MNPVLTIKINWNQYSPNGTHPAQRLLDSVRHRLEAFSTSKSAAVSAHIASGECSYVYSACGTCPDGGARVDAYCSDGGSTPDFSWCEDC